MKKKKPWKPWPSKNSLVSSKIEYILTSAITTKIPITTVSYSINKGQRKIPKERRPLITILRSPRLTCSSNSTIIAKNQAKIPAASRSSNPTLHRNPNRVKDWSLPTQAWIGHKNMCKPTETVRACFLTTLPQPKKEREKRYEPKKALTPEQTWKENLSLDFKTFHTWTWSTNFETISDIYDFPCINWCYYQYHSDNGQKFVKIYYGNSGIKNW